MNNLLQANVKIAVTGLAEILNTFSQTSVEREAGGRFKCSWIQDAPTWVKVSWRLEKRGHSRQQCWHTETDKLRRHIAESGGNLERNSRLYAIHATDFPATEHCSQRPTLA